MTLSEEVPYTEDDQKVAEGVLGNAVRSMDGFERVLSTIDRSSSFVGKRQSLDTWLRCVQYATP